jgi:hypothetical protein
MNQKDRKAVGIVVMVEGVTPYTELMFLLFPSGVLGTSANALCISKLVC